MQLLIHFLGGENSLIVHLEFKVSTSNYHTILETYKATMAPKWFETTSN